MKSLKRKVEDLLRDYLASLAGPGGPIEGVPVFGGHRSGARTLPCVIAYVEAVRERSEFSPGAGVFDAEAKVFILTQADDEDFPAHDRRVAAVRAALEDRPAIIGMLEERSLAAPESAFHLYDWIAAGSDEGRDERHFGEVLGFTAVCHDLGGG